MEKRKIVKESDEVYEVIKSTEELQENGLDGNANVIWEKIGVKYNIRSLSDLLFENKGKFRYLGSVEIAQDLKAHYREREQKKRNYFKKQNIKEK